MKVLIVLCLVVCVSATPLLLCSDNSEKKVQLLQLTGNQDEIKVLVVQPESGISGKRIPATSGSSEQVFDLASGKFKVNRDEIVDGPQLEKFEKFPVRVNREQGESDDFMVVKDAATNYEGLLTRIAIPKDADDLAAINTNTGYIIVIYTRANGDNKDVFIGKVAANGAFSEADFKKINADRLSAIISGGYEIDIIRDEATDQVNVPVIRFRATTEEESCNRGHVDVALTYGDICVLGANGLIDPRTHKYINIKRSEGFDLETTDIRKCTKETNAINDSPSLSVCSDAVVFCFDDACATKNDKGCIIGCDTCPSDCNDECTEIGANTECPVALESKCIVAEVNSVKSTDCTRQYYCPCPVLRCPAPPDGCTLVDAVDENGCPTCGDLRCPDCDLENVKQRCPPGIEQEDTCVNGNVVSKCKCLEECPATADGCRQIPTYGGLFTALDGTTKPCITGCRPTDCGCDGACNANPATNECDSNSDDFTALCVKNDLDVCVPKGKCCPPRPQCDLNCAPITVDGCVVDCDCDNTPTTCTYDDCKRDDPNLELVDASVCPDGINKRGRPAICVATNDGCAWDNYGPCPPTCNCKFPKACKESGDCAPSIILTAPDGSNFETRARLLAENRGFTGDDVAVIDIERDSNGSARGVLILKREDATDEDAQAIVTDMASSAYFEDEASGELQANSIEEEPDTDSGSVCLQSFLF